MASEREVKMILKVIPKGNEAVKRMFNEIAKGGGQFAGGGQQAVNKVAGKIFEMHKAANDLNTALRPDLVEAEAQAILKLTEAQQKHKAAVEAAMEKIAPTVKPVAPPPPTLWQKFVGQMSGRQVGKDGKHEQGTGALAIAGALQGGVGGVLKGLAAAAGPVGIAISAATDVVIGLGKAAMDFAGKASPATMQRFNQAINDMQAVIGRMFVPVLELATSGIRLMGDALATILPSASEMRDLLSPVKGMHAALRQAFSDIAPALKLIVKAGLELFGVVIQIQSAIVRLGILITRYLNPLFYLGRAMGGGGPLKSSHGAAGTDASFVGLSQLGDQAAQAAYSSGYQGTAERTASAAESTASKVATIAGYMEFFIPYLRGAGFAVRTAESVMKPFIG